MKQQLVDEYLERCIEDVLNYPKLNRNVVRYLFESYARLVVEGQQTMAINEKEIQEEYVKYSEQKILETIPFPLQEKKMPHPPIFSV